MSISSIGYVVGNTLFSSKRRIAGTIFGAIMVLSLPVALVVLNQQQDTRQQASECMKTVCPPGTHMCTTVDVCTPSMPPSNPAPTQQVADVVVSVSPIGGRPATLSLLDSLISDIKSSGMSESYKVLLVSQLSSVGPYMNSNNIIGNAYACSILGTVNSTFQVYANPQTGSGMTQANLTDWTNKLNQIRSSIPCPGFPAISPVVTVPVVISPTVVPSITQTTLACDPDSTGASLGRIDGADLLLARNEILGIVTTHKASCMTSSDSDSTSGQDILAIRNRILGIN